MRVTAPSARGWLQERVARSRAMYNDAAVQQHRAWRMRCDATAMTLRARERRHA